MNYISMCVEQLDLAVKQLQFKDSSYDRFSLILTDNIVELILHRQCERLIQQDSMWKSLGKQKYSEKVRKDALGQNFKGKTKFCKDEKLISEEEQVFVNICHKHRNVLYHVGVKYNDILHSLAILYHQFGCELFKRLKPNSYWIPLPKAKHSEAVEKHLNPSSKDFDILKAADDACDSLSKERPAMPVPFPEVLSNSALGALEEVENRLDCLVNDSFHKTTEEQVIQQVQLWNFLEGKNTIEEAMNMSGEKYDNFFKAIEYLEQNWRAPIRNNPIPSWKKRAEGLETEKNDFACMIKYDTLRTDMSVFENAVQKAAIALDEEINLQIDMARGK